MGNRRDTQDLLIDTLVAGPDPEFDPEFALPRDEHPDFEEEIAKHAAPIHPGTGTDQSVHGGGTVFHKPNPDDYSDPLDAGAITARWIDDYDPKGGAQKYYAYLKERGIGLEAPGDLNRAQGYRALAAVVKVHRELEELGVDIRPKSIVLHNQSGNPALASTYHNEKVMLNLANLTMPARESARGFKYGTNSIEDSYLHELGHVLNLQVGSEFNGDQLLEEYGPLLYTKYGMMTYSERNRPTPAITGDHSEYTAEAFFAAVRAEQNRGGPNVKKVDPELRALLLSKARLPQEAMDGRRVRKLDEDSVCLGYPVSMADFIVKHYGPGPHPGTGTEQSVHGDRGTQPQLHDTLFGEEPPNPETRLKFTYDEEKRRFAEANASNWSNLFGRSHPALQLAEFGIEDQLVVRHAVEAWEQFAPGTLPEEVEFRVSTSPDGEPALAWVDIDVPSTENVVFINDELWNDDDIMDDQIGMLMTDPTILSAADEIIDNHTSGEYGAGTFTMKTAAIFHELAHVASKHQGWAKGHGRNWPVELPYYSESWYPEMVFDDDPSIPSTYALSHPAEFFAEAMVDVWLNGADAAPLSHHSFKVFKELTKKA